MKYNLYTLSRYIYHLNWFRRIRFVILIFLDIFALLISLKFTSNVINGTINDSQFINIILIYLISGFVVYFFNGQYKSISKYIDINALYKIGLNNIFLQIICSVFLFNLRLSIDFLLINFLIVTNLQFLFKIIFKEIINRFISKNDLSNKKRIAIYGAGSAGAQLAAAINIESNVKIVSFIDDSPSLWNRSINNIPIIPATKIIELKDKVDQICLAIPSLTNNQRQKILKKINSFTFNKIEILEVPTLDEISEKKVSISKMRTIKFEDLLFRKPVDPDFNLLSSSIREKVVCVTGGAGSIGSELCRQILKLDPMVNH